MVRILSSPLVVAALVAIACASPTKRSTIAQVEADIAQINTQVTALDTGIESFPATGGTITQLLVSYVQVAISATKVSPVPM